MEKDIQNLRNLIAIYRDFANTRRVTYTKTIEDMEDDAGHSYSVALLAWFLLKHEEFKHLDHAKVLKYALAHDLPEVYTGDFDAYAVHASDDLKKQKEEGEREACEKLKTALPEFTELHEHIEAYEKKEDPESLFVYVIDKLIPLLVILESGKPQWKESKHTYEELRAYKDDKFTLMPELQDYYQQILAILEARKDELFYHD